MNAISACLILPQPLQAGRAPPRPYGIRGDGKVVSQVAYGHSIAQAYLAPIRRLLEKSDPVRRDFDGTE